MYKATNVSLTNLVHHTWQYENYIYGKQSGHLLKQVIAIITCLSDFSDKNLLVMLTNFTLFCYCTAANLLDLFLDISDQLYNFIDI